MYIGTFFAFDSLPRIETLLLHLHNEEIIGLDSTTIPFAFLCARKTILIFLFSFKNRLNNVRIYLNLLIISVSWSADNDSNILLISSDGLLVKRKPEMFSFNELFTMLPAVKEKSIGLLRVCHIISLSSSFPRGLLKTSSSGLSVVDIGETRGRIRYPTLRFRDHRLRLRFGQ